MQIIWPASINPSVASLVRHVVRTQAHLVPPQRRGVLVESIVTRQHEALSRRSIRLSSRRPHIQAVLDTTMLVREATEWNRTVHLSMNLLDVVVPTVRRSGSPQCQIEADPKQDPELLQVVTITDHTGKRLTKFADVDLMTTSDQAATIPLDLTTYPEMDWLHPDDAHLDHPSVRPLRKMAYSSARFFRAVDTNHHVLVGARWTRLDVTTTAVTPL